MTWAAIEVAFLPNNCRLQDRFYGKEHVSIKGELYRYMIGNYLDAVRG